MSDKITGEPKVGSPLAGSVLHVDLTQHIKNGMTILSLEDVAKRKRVAPREIWPSEEEPNKQMYVNASN